LLALLLEVAAHAGQATMGRVSREEIIGKEMSMHIARAHNLDVCGVRLATRGKQEACHAHQEEEFILLHCLYFFYFVAK
jgi:hypothetical protein